MPKPTPDQEAFGTDLAAPENVPVSTQGMLRPTTNASVGQTVIDTPHA